MQVKRTKKLNALIALEIILTMTLYYFIFVGDAIITYAAELIESLNPEIEMNAYFVDQNGNKLKEIEAAVNEENLNLYVDIAVKSEGCFNGAIYLNNSNFEIAKETVDENIVSVDGNKVNLKQIDGKSDVTINLKISPIKADSYKLENLNKETEVAVEGTYKISDSKKSEFSRAKNVKLTIKNPYEGQDDSLILNANVITNGTFKVGDDVKKIIQVYLTSNLKDNIYPVKNNKISIKLPENVQNVEVLSRGTEATDGKTEKEFESSNWKFDKTSSILTINVENKEIDGTINWKDNALDKFIVNLTFDEKEDLSNANIIIKGQADLWNQKSTSIKTIELTDFTKNVEEIIKADINIQNEKIYKGYLYTKEETEFSSNSTIDIRYSNISSNIKYTENITKYICANDTLDANGGYTKSKVNKEDLFKVIGQKGEISITNEEGKILKNINWNTEADENGDIVIDLAKEKKLNIEIKNAENTGTITFRNTLFTLEEGYSKEQLKDVKKINIQGTLEAGNLANNKQVTEDKALTESASGAKIIVSNKQLSTSETNKNVEIKSVLYTNSSKFNLFKNPVIKIKFPSEIKDVNINNVKLVYDNQLKIDNENILKTVEDGNIVVKIPVLGEQTRHVKSDVIKGANIILNCDINCNKEVNTAKEKIIMTYENEGEENYYYNATYNVTIKYVMPQKEEAKLSVQNTETANVGTDQNSNENTNTDQNTNVNINVVKTLKTGDKTDILQRNVYEYIINVKNNETKDLTNVILKDTLPDDLIYINEVLDQGYQSDFVEVAEKRELTETIDTLKAGETKSYSYKVSVKKDDSNVGKVIGTKATVTVGEKVIESNEPQNTIKQNDLQVWQFTDSYGDYKLDESSTVEYFVKVKNCSGSDMTNVKIEDYLSKQFEYISSCYMEKLEDGEWNAQLETTGTYDETKNLVTWSVASLPANGEIGAKVKISLKKIETNASEITISNKFKASTENAENESNNIDITERGKNRVGIQLESSLKDTYLTEGDEFQYTITINNYNDFNVNIEVEDELPSGIEGKTLKYTSNVEETGEVETEIGNSVSVSTSVEAGKQKKFVISVKAEILEPEQKTLEIKNKAKVSGMLIESAESNELVNIIKAKTIGDIPNEDSGDEGKDDTGKDDTGKDDSGKDDEKPENPDDNNGEDNKGEDEDNNNGDEDNSDNENNDNNGDDSDNNDDSNESGSDGYAISGIAWLDVNENGQRDSGETFVENVTVRLLYADTGNDVKDQNNNSLTVKTNSEGKYKFENLEEYNYMIVFEYDNKKYELTEYQATGVNENLNSDATVYDTDDGDSNNPFGMTDTIYLSGEDEENIDIGLIPKKIFDLKLDKYVSKITLNNDKGSTVYDLNNSQLAKVEVNSKYVDNTVVNVEYKIVITNEGQVTGYAKKIIDYIPEGFNFDISENDGWKIDEGNLIYTGIEDEKIAPGESKTIYLRLGKDITRESLGTITNAAEIYEDYNTYGIDDTDSTPNNKDTSEDDLSSASIILGISTGKTATYCAIIFIIVAVLAVGGYLIKKEVLDGK